MFFAQLGLKCGIRQFLRWSTAAPAVDAGTLLRGYEWVGRRVKLPALALF